MKGKDGLSMATAAPIWDRAWRQTAQKMGGEPPTWIQIFPYPSYVCTIDGEKTTLITDDLSQREIVAYFDEKGNAATIDYEHASTSEGVYYAPAAGRIPRLVAGGKLGLLGQCEWNEDGERDLASGRYYYDSPTFWWAADDMRIYVFDSLALTNRPGSFNRSYLTDHNEIDYQALLTQTAAKQRASTGYRPLRLKCAKGGDMATKPKTIKFQKEKLTDDALRNLRYAMDLSATTTGNELRTLLMALHDNVPATDEPIFIIEDDAPAAAAQKAATTIGELLGIVSQKDAGVDAAVAAQLQPIRLALAVADEKADGQALAVAALTLKATTVPIAQFQAVQKQLTEAQQKTTTDGLALKIAECRQKGVVILPFHEAEAKRLAAQSMDLAIAYIDALPPLDFTAQSTTSAAPREKDTTTTTGGTTLHGASQAAERRTREIMKEKNVSYVVANGLRLEEESVQQS